MRFREDLGSTQMRERFFGLTKQDPRSDCLLWVGPKNKGGYGRCFRLKSLYYNPLAHRVAFWLKWRRWPIPNACHHCDNPACVKWEHLFEGSHSDNFKDMHRKGRTHNVRKTHCKHGHPLSGDNLRVEPMRGRGCRACGLISSRNSRKRKLAGLSGSRPNNGSYNRSKTTCKHGHPFSGDNLIIVCGQRTCRICNNARALKYYYKNKATA
jgi:hypothetical protein